MSGHGAEVEVPHNENDPFVKRVALSVAVFAVVLALAAAGGNNAGKDMMMNQLKASNEWSRYQAKVQREVLYAQEREDLEQTFGVLKAEEVENFAKQYEAGQKDRNKLPLEKSDRQKLRLGFVTSKLAEYKRDKDDLSKLAKEFEVARDLAHKKDPFFDMAELLLQIGIVLASVAMLSRTRWAFLGGCVLFVGGLTLTVLGYFYPEVPVPFVNDSDSTPGGH